ncbi:uncharacterized protein LOC121877310 [Homarus americanus]|uniref:uncharacterized protein LOC121877310 n=1 Tax=Homarus americanus TaxID=6706 RepID=UPI001C4402A6|nr:uncharacterized protein LOC121877310 [Homarus americanus]XP_042238929.1 uncharacterized protein LOC121877310 [Homarus americanus]
MQDTKSNIQVDRGKLPSRKRFKGFLNNRDTINVRLIDFINEDSEEYLQDDSDIWNTGENTQNVPELLSGKRNVTGQALQQTPGDSKETRHEKLTRNFPAQLTEQGESTEAFSEDFTETQLREGEGTEKKNKDGVKNKANRGIDSLTDSTDNSKDLGLNGTALDRPQKVNLDTLEMELSEKDEEATSDLLLAISILQHHLVPDTSGPRQETNTQPPLPPTALSLSHSWIGQGSPITLNVSKVSSPSAVQESNKKYNIEIFDPLPPGSDETTAETEAVIEETNLQQTSLQDGPDMRERGSSRYRWFVLVLDGNCSVIKQRMTTFVTFLKAALSAKLTVDYNDVYVPSVFCDNTFMVNISLDIHQFPQVEVRLRKLAEANTTLLEISEEIFYLEKILTKRTDEEDQDFQPVIKKTDDVELVIYIAVGCMCVFILLSVVIVMLIRVCRQEGDPLDLGKPHPHQIIPRSLDFPI